MTARKDEFLVFVLDQMHRLDGVRPRRMFGAYGLYLGDTFFAIVNDGAVYFRTNDSGRADYVGTGQKPFEPKPGQKFKNYYEVPVDVLEDDALLCEWAKKAVAAQAESKAAPKTKTKKKRRSR